MRSAPATCSASPTGSPPALAEDHFTAPEHLARAKIDTIRLTARQLLLIDAQRRAWEKRMGELLLGTPGQPRGGPAGASVSWRRDLPELSRPRSPSRRQDRRRDRRAHRAVHHAELTAMLCRARPGHPPLRQAGPGRGPPARLQPLPGRRGAQVGVRQPAPLRLGQGVLRRPARPRQEPPRGPASPRQPLARSPLALPHPRRALRRDRPHRQPQPGPRRDHSTSSLTFHAASRSSDSRAWRQRVDRGCLHLDGDLSRQDRGTYRKDDELDLSCRAPPFHNTDRPGKTPAPIRRPGKVVDPLYWILCCVRDRHLISKVLIVCQPPVRENSLWGGFAQAAYSILLLRESLSPHRLHCQDCACRCARSLHVCPILELETSEVGTSIILSRQQSGVFTYELAIYRLLRLHKLSIFWVYRTWP